MSRITVQNEWVARADFITDGGENWVLEYYLQAFETEDAGAEIFGLKIEKNTPGGVPHETEETGAIFESKEDALIMAKAFAKGSVPPVTLLEMTDEWYDENEVRIFA